jgi:hypothetical protein
VLAFHGFGADTVDIDGLRPSASPRPEGLTYGMRLVSANQENRRCAGFATPFRTCRLNAFDVFGAGQYISASNLGIRDLFATLNYGEYP